MGTEPDLGQISVIWYDDTRDGQNKLLVPIDEQNIQHTSHMVPIEAEENNWDKAQMLAWLINEVNDVADIPQWAEDEVGTYTLKHVTRLRKTVLA